MSIVENPGLIHPWLDWISSFSDRICIGKAFKYMRKAKNMILDCKWDFKMEGFV